ncbi:MAG: hypothetical protein KJ852_01315 [Gammaproteobacteria bacterium]|nr:hypothetical protein [Gammaproteobacteria bacterium]MBU0788191.1 hypothetical protein [Gammaproteobacteria bacterium]MBU0815312.1 hypothetical protein [Gammaproteobacteria bacterium]MBU1785580.1 hypothetical protein [Gammaproteobacteria bacterium]
MSSAQELESITYSDHTETLELFTRLLDAPRGLPALMTVAESALKAVTYVFSRLPSPNQSATIFQKKFSVMVDEIRSGQTDRQKDAPNALKGLKHKHPFWCLLADPRASKGRLANLYAGLQILLAFSRAKSVPQSGARHLSTIIAEEDVPHSSIDMLLRGITPDETVDAPWLHSLHKSWRDVIRAYSIDEPPPPSPRGRVVGAIMNNVFLASTAQRAGATKHRNLSDHQVRNAFAVIASGLDTDTFDGALGMMVAITGFPVDVVAELEILDRVVDGAWPAGIAIEEGLIKVNFETMINEPSRALPGSLPSSFFLVRPLPSNLHHHLQLRLSHHPTARHLHELYPDSRVPRPEQSLYPCKEEITPSWARLRYSVGLFLRQTGLDCLSTFIVSCDLSHIPRSKLHYAHVSSSEIWQSMRHLYAMAGWCKSAEYSNTTMGFGCRAVPTLESLQQHDRHLVEAADESRPGNHSSLTRLLAFHNNFITLSAWRLSVLLALREAIVIDLPASIDETSDTWIGWHDKVTPNDQGLQPVPLCDFVRHTIGCIRSHSRHMHSRLTRMKARTSDFARWCDGVAKAEDLRLLCVATDTLKAVPVSTHNFILPRSTGYELAPDCGRKVMENHLRHAGLPSTYIDAVLRHTIHGQHRLNAFSNVCLDQMVGQTAGAMNVVANNLFGQVISGLSKE